MVSLNCSFPCQISYYRDSVELARALQGAMAVMLADGSLQIPQIPAIRVPAAGAGAAAGAWLGQLAVRALAAWPRVRLVVVILAYRRLASLQRLCRSLEQAYYFGDQVDVMVHVDAGADADSMAGAAAVATFVNEWTWPHGRKTLRQRTQHAGLVLSVVEAWTPTSDDEFAVLLEDDVSVSPQWYDWAKRAVLTYNYGPRSARLSGQLYGVSLYTPRLLELQQPRRRFDAHTELAQRPPACPFLFPVPCSWGSVYFPRHWRQFQDYMARVLLKVEPPYTVPGSASNGWAASWKKHFIELVHQRRWVALYPNFANQTSFSTNHLEPGEHIGTDRTRLAHLPRDYTVPLWDARVHYSSQLPFLPPKLTALPRLDLFGNLAVDGR